MGKSVRYEPRQVAQDEGAERVSKTYSGGASRVPYLRIRVSFKTELLGTNPVGLPKM